jgi:hypothetical protein
MIYVLNKCLSLTKSRRIRQEGHVARTGLTEMHKRFWQEDLKLRSHLKDQDIDKIIILKWMFIETGGEMMVCTDMVQYTDK